MPTTRRLTLERENEALEALATCGIMSSRQLSEWVYGVENRGAAQTKAQRLLSRLEAKGFIIRRDAVRPGSGLVVWVLSRAGAERVNDELEDAGYRRWAHHGTDLGLMLGERATAVTDFLVKRKTAGFMVFGRAALRAGVLSASQFGGCDAAIAKETEDGRYTVSGVVFIADAYSSTVRRVKTVIKALGDSVETLLIGELRRVRELRKFLGQ